MKSGKTQKSQHKGEEMKSAEILLAIYMKIKFLLQNELTAVAVETISRK